MNNRAVNRDIHLGVFRVCIVLTSWNVIKLPREQVYLENIKSVRAKPRAYQYLKLSKMMKEKIRKETGKEISVKEGRTERDCV